LKRSPTSPGTPPQGSNVVVPIKQSGIGEDSALGIEERIVNVLELRRGKCVALRIFSTTEKALEATAGLASAVPEKEASPFWPADCRSGRGAGAQRESPASRRNQRSPCVGAGRHRTSATAASPGARVGNQTALRPMSTSARALGPGTLTFHSRATVPSYSSRLPAKVSQPWGTRRLLASQRRSRSPSSLASVSRSATGTVAIRRKEQSCEPLKERPGLPPDLVRGLHCFPEAVLNGDALDVAYPARTLRHCPQGRSQSPANGDAAAHNPSTRPRAWPDRPAAPARAATIVTSRGRAPRRVRRAPWCVPRGSRGPGHASSGYGPSAARV